MRESKAASGNDSYGHDRPVFKALLTPHRSLGRKGLTILLSMVAAASLGYAALFAMAGAWPIPIFFGLELVLLIGAFWLNNRAARAHEIVSVSRTDLSVLKVAPSGRSRDFHCNPLWARFDVARHDEIGITAMHISGQGHTTDVGSFLNPDDRESFADAFSGALATVRRG
ncbi:MAG: DUF2244 domain-containing protein [Pseudomonadota bacterium]